MIVTEDSEIVVRDVGLIDYQTAYARMRAYTDVRDEDMPDEIWLLQHPPVFTLGLGGRDEHVHDAGGIPVVKTDRGGQVTYHGPGQLVVYVLLDLKRRGYGVRSLVHRLEQALINYLDSLGLVAERHEGAPGVFVQDAKIAALGLRVKNGCSYHGLSLNVAMNLEPFGRIDPCGYPGLKVTQLADRGVEVTVKSASRSLLPHLQEQLHLPMLQLSLDRSVSEVVADE